MKPLSERIAAFVGDNDWVDAVKNKFDEMDAATCVIQDPDGIIYCCEKEPRFECYWTGGGEYYCAAVSNNKVANSHAKDAFLTRDEFMQWYRAAPTGIDTSTGRYIRPVMSVDLGSGDYSVQVQQSADGINFTVVPPDYTIGFIGALQGQSQQLLNAMHEAQTAKVTADVQAYIKAKAEWDKFLDSGDIGSFKRARARFNALDHSFKGTSLADVDFAQAEARVLAAMEQPEPEPQINWDAFNDFGKRRGF